MAKFTMSKGVPAPKKYMVSSNILSEKFKKLLIKKCFNEWFPIQDVKVIFVEDVEYLNDLDVKVPKKLGVSIKGEWDGKVSGFYLSETIYETTGVFTQYDELKLKWFVKQLIWKTEQQLYDKALEMLKEKQNG